MKSIKLTPKGASKISRNEISLTTHDIEASTKSLLPGEWVVFTDGFLIKQMGFMTPESTFALALLVGAPSQIHETPGTFIKERLELVWQKRCLLGLNLFECRLVNGLSEGLPGLIVDGYHSHILIQINNAGFDNYRDLIKNWFVEKTTTYAKEINLAAPKVYLWDQEQLRTKANLPTYPVDWQSDEVLKIEENGLNFEIPFEQLQKIGHYYDHADNRLKLVNSLKKLNFDSSFRAWDLFSYQGAWGRQLLKEELISSDNITFIDQGKFEANFSKLGLHFERKDVFAFLDDKINKTEKVNLIISDPPAFAKSIHQKQQAIDGYQRLHHKLIKCLEAPGILAIGSCTHNVSSAELELTVLKAAQKEKREITLLDIGIQRACHPITTQQDQSSYIKYLLYLVQ